MTASRLDQLLEQVVSACVTAWDLLPLRPPKLAPDGLPIPPPALMHRVAGTSDVGWFLDRGQAAVQDLIAFIDPSVPTTVLDFGCGCGRVTRGWKQYPTVLPTGVDIDPLAILWCRRRLRLGKFLRSSLAAPLRLPGSSFDFAYALSVLTHLTLPLQEHVLRELARVLKPSGRLAVSLHGAECAERLPLQLKESFDGGELVIATYGRDGSNLVNAFHPPQRAAELFSPAFELEAFKPSGA